MKERRRGDRRRFFIETVPGIMSRFIIGIDLGTTNSALAAIDVQRSPRVGNPTITPFPMPQLVAAGRGRGRGRCCRRFSTCRAQHDLPPGRTALPWDAQRALRRRRVRPQPRRHAFRAGWSPRPSRGCVTPASIAPPPLLPWSAPPDVPRISPVEASAALSAPPGRGVEPRHGQRPAGRSPGEAAGRADRAGVVRRRGPQR